MSFVSDSLAKIRDLAERGVDFLKTLPGRLAALIPRGGEHERARPILPAGKLSDALEAVSRGTRGLFQKLPALDNLKKFIPAGKTKFLFFGLVAALFILVICLIGVVSGMSRTPKNPAKGTGPLGGVIQSPAIPPEELFLPEEPDFLPGPVPEQEQRDVWSAEDAEPFWYNPLEKGEEQWRDRIESVIDELLEHVP